MATDDAGRFELKVPTGEYTLSIQYLGFDPVLRQVRVDADNDLGDIVLKSSSTQIEGVVVKAQLIRREADRFVVDVANARRRSARMASNCWSALRAYGWTTRRSRSTARAVRRCTSTTASCAWNRRSC